ncbi:DUF2847 family protein [Candidatus Parcubacteria bacterium]|nr:MAG: DUF2847 family protein [Candidatus Parcubacteria bacterium]
MFKLLETESEWNELLANNDILILFKHSRTSPVSVDARERLKAVEYLIPNIYQIVVQDSEALSQLIANELGIEHQSPQLLVIKDGRVVYHRDDGDVKGDQLVDFVKNLQRESK